jgi:hypothetical protein
MKSELDRDRGGPQTRARPTLPGEPTFTPRPKPILAFEKLRPLAGSLLVFSLLLPLGLSCASLSTLTRHAAQAQRDTAALVVALDSYLEQCEVQEPRPSGCAEAGRLRASIEPYTELVK